MSRNTITVVKRMVIQFAVQMTIAILLLALLKWAFDGGFVTAP